MKIKLICIVFVLLFISSCVSVKPHEMVYLNDLEMQMGNSNNSNFEQYIESIREGSAAAGSGKSSGGCGCN